MSGENASATNSSLEDQSAWITVQPLAENETYNNFYGAVALALICTGVASAIGNILLIYTFCRQERLRKKAANLLTIHLATNNAFLGLMAIRIGVKIFIHQSAQDIFNCQTEGFFLSVVHMNVMLTILAMFGDRYVVICQSVGSRSWLGICHHRPIRVIVLIWTHSSFWAVWPLTSIIPDYLQETLMPTCIFDRHDSSLLNKFYIIGMSLSAFAIPLMLVCMIMARIYAEVKKSSEVLRLRRGRRYLTQTVSVGSGADSSCRPENQADVEENVYIEEPIDTIDPVKQTTHQTQNTRNFTQAKSFRSEGETKVTEVVQYAPEMAVLRSAVTLVTSFSLSWTPFLIVCLLNVSGVYLNHYIIVLAILFSKASCVHSSYAYATHRHFQATIKYVTCHVCHSLFGT